MVQNLTSPGHGGVAQEVIAVNIVPVIVLLLCASRGGHCPVPTHQDRCSELREVPGGLWPERRPPLPPLSEKLRWQGLLLG